MYTRICIYIYIYIYVYTHICIYLSISLSLYIYIYIYIHIIHLIARTSWRCRHDFVIERAGLFCMRMPAKSSGCDTCARAMSDINASRALSMSGCPTVNLPSHRRGTLKGVPTVKSPNNHFQITFKSLKSNLFLDPLLEYPFRAMVIILQKIRQSARPVASVPLSVRTGSQGS